LRKNAKLNDDDIQKIKVAHLEAKESSLKIKP
jgi:hypothetical protein